MLAAWEAIGAEIPGGWRGEIVSPTMRSSAALNRGETEDIQYLFVYEELQLVVTHVVVTYLFCLPIYS